MTIKIHPIKAFSDNYIWILHNEQHAVVVDPGDDSPVESYLSQHKLTLTDILITHHHYDHVDGLVALQNKWQCTVYAPEDVRIPGQCTPVGAGDKVTIESLKLIFNVLFTPGHTLTHICYHDEGKLFCGDTLFSLGCGRMFEGTAEQFNSSLNQLKQLNDETKVYCTHEYTSSNWEFAFATMPNKQALNEFKNALDLKRKKGQPSLPSTLSTEKFMNPFLNCDLFEVVQNLENKFDVKIISDSQAFGLLRQWKDSF